MPISDEEYEHWLDWYLQHKWQLDRDYQQEIEHQQEVKEYPLFFWKESCNDKNNS